MAHFIYEVKWKLQSELTKNVHKYSTVFSASNWDAVVPCHGVRFPNMCMTYIFMASVHRFNGTVSRYEKSILLYIFQKLSINLITSERKKRFFVKGSVHNLHLKVSALYQVSYFKGHGILKIAVFLQSAQSWISKFTTVGTYSLYFLLFFKL